MGTRLEAIGPGLTLSQEFVTVQETGLVTNTGVESNQ